MSLSLSKKQLIISLGALLFFALLIVGLYFWKLDPLKSEIALKQVELKNEQKLVETIQSQSSKASEMTFESTVELQKKLPVKPLAQQLLLDLEKAEVVSNSFIKEINITEDEEASTESASASSPETNTENKDNEQNIEATSQLITTDSLPSGLEKMNITMIVQSPTFLEFLDFLTSLENMKRIITVDNITFKVEDKLSKIIEQIVKPIEYEVVISAYFAPVLRDLQKDLPSMETENPGKKKNPLYISPDREKKASS